MVSGSCVLAVIPAGSSVVIWLDVPVEQALEQVVAVVEGYFATRAVHQLTADKGLDMPICQAMYHILMEHAPLDRVITALLGRVSRAEHDAYEAAELWK